MIVYEGYGEVRYKGARWVTGSSAENLADRGHRSTNRGRA